jgi:flavin-dependent dehydrogenase
MPNRDGHIVIAGAGPAGSTLAIRLRRLGNPVTLIERYKFPREKLCGEFISPECLRHFGELDVLDEMLAAGGDRVYETMFYETGGRSISVPSRVFDEAGFALSLSRARMDEILLNTARSNDVQVLEEATACALLKKEGVVGGVKIREKTGRVREIEAALTVDATGRSRVLARMADKHAAREEPRSKFVGFKAHLRNVDMPRGVCEIYAFRGGYAGLSHVENGEANLCFLARSTLLKKQRDADNIFEFLKEKNSRARNTLAHAEKLHDWLAVSVPTFGVTKMPAAEGLLTVGDSAAFVDPFTGSGMLLAMESASIFAQCISEVGLDHIPLRERYQERFREGFSSRLKVSSLIRHVAYEPVLSRAAIFALSVSHRLRESLARRTRSTASGEVP